MGWRRRTRKRSASRIHVAWRSGGPEGLMTGPPINTARKIAARVARRLLPRPPAPPADKYGAEIAFRREAVQEYELWYRGEIPDLYETPSPTDAQKVQSRSLRHSAILTFLELVIKPKYL